MCAVSCPTVRPLTVKVLTVDNCVSSRFVVSEESKGESIQTVVFHPFLETAKIQRECHPFPVWNEEWERECSFPTPHVGCWQTQWIFGHIIQTYHPDSSLSVAREEWERWIILHSVQFCTVAAIPSVMMSERGSVKAGGCHLFLHRSCVTQSLSYECAACSFSMIVWGNRQMCP